MNILIIRPGAVGDFILTLPVLQAVRERFPQAVITLVAHTNVVPLAKPYVNRTIDIDGTFLLPLHTPRPKLGDEQRRELEATDLVISYAGEKSLLASNLWRLCPGRVLTIDPIPPPGHTGHVRAYLFGPVAPLIGNPPLPTPAVEIPGEARAFAGQFFKTFRIPQAAPLTAIHPGSGSKTKNAATEWLAALCQAIVERIPTTRFLIIEGEADREEVAALEAIFPSAFVTARNLRLVEVGALLSRCALYVGHDSGITHLAAAVGTPTVALFVASDPQRWAPRGRSVHVFVDPPSEYQNIVQVGVEALQKYGGPE